MASARSDGCGNSQTNLSEENSPQKTENDNFTRKDACKDLLKVCPDRGM